MVTLRRDTSFPSSKLPKSSSSQASFYLNEAKQEEALSTVEKEERPKGKKVQASWKYRNERKEEQRLQ